MIDARKSFADLLRRTANQSIREKGFWTEFDAFAHQVDPTFFQLAFESATHYWGNFHSRNILLIPVRPDPYELEQGKNELNLIADALESGWDRMTLELKLKDI